jgi:uncharacterized UBP type Zn finger protein
MKKSAVEWLAEQMQHPEMFNPYIEQAKEMEKQQRGYSEEEVSDLLKCLRIELNINKELIDIDKWFEQFKNK